MEFILTGVNLAEMSRAVYPMIGSNLDIVLHKHMHYLVNGDGDAERDQKLHQDDEDGPAPAAGFLLDRRYGGNAGDKKYLDH